MAIGKREQIVGLSIAVLAVIGIIHVVIFQPRAQEYAEVKQQYTAGRTTLQDAEVLTSPNVLATYRKKTDEYSAELTSVTAQLQVDVPKIYSELTADNIRARVDETTSLLQQLMAKRASVRQPQLTFLDNRPHPQSPQYQLAWNFPRQLPNLGTQGAIWDTVVRLADRYALLNSIPDPQLRLEQRAVYNQFLAQLGMAPIEVSYFVANSRVGPVYFNETKLSEQLGTQAIRNAYCIDRFGVAVPELRKFVFLDLLYRNTDGRTPPVARDRMAQVLEINLPWVEETYLTINRQLKALIDIIEIAEKNQVLEISEVRLLRPVEIAKVEQREPGKTPTPKETPATQTGAGPSGVIGRIGGGAVNPNFAQAGPTPIPADKVIGSGAGIEITFRATNPNMIGFLFDLGTSPRTYAVDDLHIQTAPDGILSTSTTIELVTKLNTLSSPASANATPSSDQ